MERLTFRDDIGIVNSLTQDIWDSMPDEVGERVQVLAEKLAAYEDLGTVEELAQLSNKNYELKQRVEEIETQFAVESDYVQQLLDALEVDTGSIDDGVDKANELKAENTELKKQVELGKLVVGQHFELAMKCMELEKQVAKLQAQLANAIVPKYKKGDMVGYLTERGMLYSGEIKTVKSKGAKIQYSIVGEDKQLHIINEVRVFSTKAEALAALEALKGGER